MDVHVRDSVLKVKDDGGQVVARGRSGNTMFELSLRLASPGRDLQAKRGVSPVAGAPGLLQRRGNTRGGRVA